MTVGRAPRSRQSTRSSSDGREFGDVTDLVARRSRRAIRGSVRPDDENADPVDPVDSVAARACTACRARNSSSTPTPRSAPPRRGDHECCQLALEHPHIVPLYDYGASRVVPDERSGRPIGPGSSSTTHNASAVTRRSASAGRSGTAPTSGLESRVGPSPACGQSRPSIRISALAQPLHIGQSGRVQFIVRNRSGEAVRDEITTLRKSRSAPERGCVTLRPKSRTP